MSAEDALAAQVRGQVLAGVYRHYKGPLYLVLGLARDANADTVGDTVGCDDYGHLVQPFGERLCIAYVALQTDGAKSGAALIFRSRGNFEEWIDPEYRNRKPLSVAEVDRFGTKIVREDGYVPRFEYVGPERPLG